MPRRRHYLYLMKTEGAQREGRNEDVGDLDRGAHTALRRVGKKEGRGGGGSGHCSHREGAKRGEKGGLVQLSLPEQEKMGEGGGKGRAVCRVLPACDLRVPVPPRQREMEFERGGDLSQNNNNLLLVKYIYAPMRQ